MNMVKYEDILLATRWVGKL